MKYTSAMLAPTAGLLAGLLALGGCDHLDLDFGREPLTLPSAAEAEAFYGTHADIEAVEVNGNVVEVRVHQPPRQLRRGGELWAKVGPYIYLLSPATRELLDAYDGVAAVRVVTLGPEGAPVARAMLVRDELNDLLWRRTLNILGHALQEGTERPTRLEDLVAWGEEHTEYWYSPAYVPD